MMKNNFNFLFLFLIILKYILAYGDAYYQILDNYSFNLRNKKDWTKFYENFGRMGDTIFYDKFIGVAPLKNNTYGMFYTKEQIVSSEIELQIKFRINNERGKGSAFAIWFFKDEVDDGDGGKINYIYYFNLDNFQSFDPSFVGFKRNFNGYAVLVMTPPKTTMDSKSYVFVQENDGKEFKFETGLRKVAMDNSCNENFKGRTVKLTMKLETMSNNMAIHYNSREHLHYPCLGFAKVEKLEPPFRIGISSLNGMMEGQQFLDNVQIEKFTVFNLNEDVKDEYLKHKHSEAGEEVSTTTDTPQVANITNDLGNQINDLIDSYPDFLNNYNNLNNPKFITELNKKFNLIIAYLSDVIKNIEIKENLENEEQIKNLTSILNTYKDYINFLQDRFKELKRRLSNISIKLNENLKENLNTTAESNESELIKLSPNKKLLTEMDYEIFFREVDKLKREWDNNKIKQVLSSQLNIMLSDKVDEIVNTLKLTEGAHIKMAGKLNDKLRDNSNYIADKIDTNYFTYCIVLGLVIVVNCLYLFNYLKNL